MAGTVSAHSQPYPRVVFLTDDLGGGTGHHLLSMVRHWDQEKWRARIVTLSRPSDRVPAAVRVEYLPPLRGITVYPIAQLRNMKRIRAAVAREGVPDITHTYFFWSILYGRFLKRTGKTRVLVENREDQGFSWGRHEYAWLRATRSAVDRVVCVSEAVREVVLRREGLDEGRVCIIRNGVEPVGETNRDRVQVRRELGIAEDHLVVGMVANYNRPVKGVSFLLDAIPSIVREVPSARFLFLGGGDREGPALRDKARNLGIERFVTFTGYRNDVHRFYEAMDISVLTSLTEGLSITLLESMSHALPVVATDVGGNPEVVVDGRTGYLVPARDVPTLADRIVRLLRNPDLRSRMGEAGLRRVEKDFRMQNVANRYLDLYGSMAPTSSPLGAGLLS